MAYSNDFLVRLPGRFWPPGSLRITPVDAFQHVAELRLGDRDNTVRGCRPDEPPAFQPLRVERHAQAVVPEDLQKITTAATKHVDVTGMGITLQGLLHLQRQSIHAAAHVSRARRQPDLQPVASQTFTPDGGAIIRAGPSAHDAAWPG